MKDRHSRRSWLRLILGLLFGCGATNSRCSHQHQLTVGHSKRDSAKTGIGSYAGSTIVFPSGTTSTTLRIIPSTLDDDEIEVIVVGFTTATVKGLF